MPLFCCSQVRNKTLISVSFREDYFFFETLIFFALRQATGSSKNIQKQQTQFLERYLDRLQSNSCEESSTQTKRQDSGAKASDKPMPPKTKAPNRPKFKKRTVGQDNEQQKRSLFIELTGLFSQWATPLPIDFNQLAAPYQLIDSRLPID